MPLKKRIMIFIPILKAPIRLKRCLYNCWRLFDYIEYQKLHLNQYQRCTSYYTRAQEYFQIFHIIINNAFYCDNTKFRLRFGEKNYQTFCEFKKFQVSIQHPPCDSRQIHKQQQQPTTKIQILRHDNIYQGTNLYSKIPINMEMQHQGMAPSSRETWSAPPHVRRVAWEWIALLSCIATPGSTKDIVGVLIELHRCRSADLGIGMTFLYPLVIANFSKYSALIKRWRKRDKQPHQAKTYQRKLANQKTDDIEMKDTTVSEKIHDPNTELIQEKIVIDQLFIALVINPPIQQENEQEVIDDVVDVIRPVIGRDQAYTKRHRMRRMPEANLDSPSRKKKPKRVQDFPGKQLLLDFFIKRKPPNLLQNERAEGQLINQ